jgi:signal transduction protein with GAF and PtsI domain
LSNYTNNLEEFGDVVLKELVNFLYANQGAFYVETEQGGDEIKMISCYAYEKKKYLDHSLKKGQGLVGQVWLEAKPIYLTEVPEKYVTITSGLGESTPRAILIVPLIFNDRVQGVIELASFNLLEDYEQGFIEKVTQSISAALASVKINTRTQVLLQESSDLTEQMRKQEDLMLSKVDELNQSQEETRHREVSYIREINRLKRKIELYERNL